MKLQDAILYFRQQYYFTGCNIKLYCTILKHVIKTVLTSDHILVHSIAYDVNRMSIERF